MITKDEFEDKLADLVAEYIKDGEGVQYDEPNFIEANYQDEKHEVSIELQF
jgi:hypothetical protein